MTLLERYEPQSRPEEWAEVSGFARDAAVFASSVSGREPVQLLKILGPYLLWCVFEHGLELEPERVFSAQFIELYCQKWIGRTGAAYKSALMAVAYALIPESDPSFLTPVPRKDIQTPYTAGELLVLRTWARGQHTKLKRRRAKLLLALGAGAGLWNRELVGTRGPTSA